MQLTESLTGLSSVAQVVTRLRSEFAVYGNVHQLASGQNPLKVTFQRFVLGAILGVIGMVRITLWQHFGLYDYGQYWPLVALTVGVALVGIVTFGSMAGSMLPFLLRRLGFDPATSSAPFVATLVDVTGLIIYFVVAKVILRGTLLP